MKSLGPVYAVIAVLMTMMVAGAGFVLLYDGSYSAEVSRDGGTVGYSVSSAGSDTYGVTVITGSPVESVFIYSDSGQGERTEAATLPVGSQPLTSSRFARELTVMLHNRGFDDVRTVGAGELQTVIGNHAEAAGRAIVCTTGALPDSVYDGTAASPILSWIEAGGILYWAGNAIGLYSTSGKEVAEHTGGPALFLGDREWCAEAGAYCTGTAGDLTDMLGLRGTGIRFAPASAGGSYTTGYTDGTYSTVTYLEHGSGQICILAGELHYDHYRNMAQLICSGVGHGSEVLGHASGTVTRGTVNGSITLTDPGADATVYVFIGKGADSTLYGRMFRTVGA